MLTSTELTSRLREAGFKVTPQRLAVYNMLSHTKAHPNADTSHHPHIRCTCCDRVDDVPALNTESVYEQVKDETGYALSDHQLYFFGVCPECQAKNATNAKTMH